MTPLSVLYQYSNLNHDTTDLQIERIISQFPVVFLVPALCSILLMPKVVQ